MSGARSQTRAVIAFVAVVTSVGVGAAFSACTSYQRSNGEGCIKNIDCLSGYCLAQVCGTPGPILNGSSYEEGGASSGEDSGSTGMPDTGSGGADTSTPSGGDSATDANPTDAAGEVGEASFPADAEGVDAISLDASNNADGDDGAVIDGAGSPDTGAGDAANGQDASFQLSRRRAFFA